MSDRFEKLAFELIPAFCALLRVMRFHDTQNEASVQASSKLLHTLCDLYDMRSDVTIVLQAEDLFVNDTRVPSTTANFEHHEALATHMKERGIGGIRFVTRPSRGTLLHLFGLLTSSGAGGSVLGYKEVRSEFERVGHRAVEVQPLGDDAVPDMPEIEPETFVRQAFFRAIGVIHHLYEQARTRKPLALKDATRVVQGFVDVVLDDSGPHRHLLLLHTGMKNWRGYLGNHAVNTCILAVSFGRALGIGRTGLRDIGVAALLTDIGSALVPATLLDSDGPLAPGEREITSLHPLLGVAAICGHQGLDRLMVKACLASAGHHRGTDGSGYPNDVPVASGLNRPVIAVCDHFDAITTPRPWRPTYLTRIQALEAISMDPGLDPVVLKAFVTWMGEQPDGAVVLRDTGEIGLIVRETTEAQRRDVSRILESLTL